MRASALFVYGACLESDKPLCLVTEYIEGGNLGEFLQNNSECVTGRETVNLSRDLAAGMMVLHRSNMLHLDLAARNLLVVITAESPLKLRICDFGLSQTIPKGQTSVSAEGCQIPWRWTSPEVVQNRAFDKSSDVWAFGVCMHEIMSRSRPYADLPTIAILSYVQGGGRLARPDIRGKPPVFATDSLVDAMFSIMMRCWNAVPTARPTFISISEELALLLECSDSELNTTQSTRLPRRCLFDI